MGFDPVTMGALAVGALGVGMQTVGAYQQSKAQQSQLNQQADIATRNQQLAEEQASADRQQGYEDKLKARQQAAQVIGTQRAMAGGSGAQVDVGGNLDLTLDTAERGEIDAMAAYQQGLNKAYASEMQAWNYGNQAGSLRAQANSINPGMNAFTTLLTGTTQLGLGFGKDLWGAASTATKTGTSAGKGIFNTGMVKAPGTSLKLSF